MAFYLDENGNVLNNTTQTKQENKQARGLGFSLAKVFGYMFLGLLITAVVAFAFGALSAYFLSIDPENTANSLFVVMIASYILTIVLSIIISFALHKARTILLVIPMVLYAVTIGIMLSSFIIFIDWWLLAGAFGITTLIFGLMSLISFFAKKMNGVLIAGISLVFGAGLISLFNLIMMLVFPEAFQTLYWLVSLAVFAGMMLITMYDLFRIKQILASGDTSNNVSLYCAFTLYVDFIYIFMKILLIILNSKK